MDINKKISSKTFKKTCLGIVIFAILLIVFKAGLLVGSKKADFSCRWSNNYHRNFAGPRNGFLSGFGDRDFIEANGTFGQIIKIDGQTLVVKGQENVEKIILIKNDTVINFLRETIKISDLKIDDSVVIVGAPNDAGQIEAKLIRVIPPPPQAGIIPLMPKMPQGNPAEIHESIKY